MPGKNARSGPYILLSGNILALFPLIAAFLAGCGSSKPAANTTVAQVLVSPASASLVAGQVLALSTSAVNSANATIPTVFTFNSSNTKVATVSPRGEVCGGVWDATFVVCNGVDASNNPISGTATITATAQSVTSGPISVTVHPSITSVTIDPITPANTCSSIGQTHQFTAHAFHNGTEITSSVGNFNWSSSDGTVASVDANGLATARLSGLGGVVASIGATTAPATPFKTCMPVNLVLHVAGDPASGFTTSVTLNTTDTKVVQVDMIDENGTVTSPAPVTILSNNPTVATLGGTTVTAQSPGGAGLLAVCAPPSCGNGLNTPIYSNLFSIAVNGTSPTSTTVYAASSFPVPTGQIMPLIPIDLSKSPIVAGMAIPLPGVPNSLVFDRTGARAYIGTDQGLAILDANANTVSLATPVPVGKVLAVSTDGSRAIISNAANNPATGTPIEPVVANQRLWVFDRNANTITTFISAGAVAASFDDDNFRAYVVANNGNVYVFSPLLSLVTENIGGSSIDVTTLASNPFVYVANSGGLDVLNTCNNAQRPAAGNPPTNSSPVQLLGSVRNKDQIIAVDSTGVNVETVTVTQLTAPTAISAANCAPNVSYSNQFFDFGLGAFTARQLIVASNGSRIAVLPAGLNKVLDVLNGVSAGAAALPAGATEALSGGMTPDGATLWVGVAGTNSVDRINLLNNVDEFQLPMSFKKVDGSAAPPNLVAIKPK